MKPKWKRVWELKQHDIKKQEVHSLIEDKLNDYPIHVQKLVKETFKLLGKNSVDSSVEVLKNYIRKIVESENDL